MKTLVLPKHEIVYPQCQSPQRTYGRDDRSLVHYLFLGNSPLDDTRRAASILRAVLPSIRGGRYVLLE
jgi:hypothetical protein